MREAVKRWSWIVLGWLLLIVGCILWMFPIPGPTLVILSGLLILSAEYAWAHNLLAKVTTRFPRLRPWVEKMKSRRR